MNEIKRRLLTVALTLLSLGATAGLGALLALVAGVPAGAGILGVSAVGSMGLCLVGKKEVSE